MRSSASLTRPTRRALLSRKINELPLNIQDTHVIGLILQLYREMETAGIAFKPGAYLSNCWGCPNMVPVIGVPFYLADPALCRLQSQMTGARPDDDATVMKVLRHEAGHTFNYAYRLYLQPEWEAVFGRFSLPYQDAYTPDPSSTGFVRHLRGCYAQKHPDDDFAETFAVWLTPDSGWQKAYEGTRALEKLRYVGRAVAEHGRKQPIVAGGRLDTPVEEMEMTLGEWYRMAYKHSDKKTARPRPCAGKGKEPIKQ
jgi:hypothetical protein